ncbi:glycosyltransferase [candidate division WWE3 bacterium]|nr:glycosyltransferase [candidate division WWE3 bacterium]
MDSISVVIPVYNSASTLKRTLGCLLDASRFIDEVYIVDDASNDDSVEIVKQFIENLSSKMRTKFNFITHGKNLGLAGTYNDGLRRCKGDIIITIHSDIIFGSEEIPKLLKPFSSADVVASCHCVKHPLKTWKTYTFWQKCLFSRLLGRTSCGLDGKFDAYRRKALEQVGYFDDNHFYRAGEDGDLREKLSRIGKIEKSGAVIVHIHNQSSNFSLEDYIYKHAQYAEAFGVLLRRHGITNFPRFIRTHFRELIFIALLVPFIRIFGAFIALSFAFFYTKAVFISEFPDRRLFYLPLVNLFLLPISFIFSLKGFIHGQQTV